MMQFSIYSRHCASQESAMVHKKRIASMLPPHGQVSVMQITDRQFADIQNFYGTAKIPPQAPPHQLEIF